MLTKRTLMTESVRRRWLMVDLTLLLSCTKMEQRFPTMPMKPKMGR